MLSVNIQKENEDLEKVSTLKSLVLATSNKNKVKEIDAILKHSGIKILPVKEGFDPVENGKNFLENAYIKAAAAARIMNMPALADDTGLEIDYLDGAPGIYSARYAETSEKRIEKVLTNLKGVETKERTARFVCAMVIVAPDGNALHSHLGFCDGRIAEKPYGKGGFGYDPIFFIPELNKTMAEMTMAEKNIYSHRGKALANVVKWVKNSTV